MNMADEIMDKVRVNPGLTALEIAVSIFGRRHPFKQRVNQVCRRLVDAGFLDRHGKGGPGDPFTYHIRAEL